jgi:beta-N-acetylhexosaminidase
MSLEEKVGQLVSIGVNAKFLPRDSAAYGELCRLVKKRHIGGIILFQSGVYESVYLVNSLQRLARYPLLVSADMESGAGMRFGDTVSIPWNMAIGATGNPKWAARQGEVIAREAVALGVRQVFAPVMDVNNNAANPIINVRSYGEDPQDVARLGSAFIEAAQKNGVIATAKHFPGHGDTEGDSHRELPSIDVPLESLTAREFVPFRAAIGAGVGSVMVAYISLPQVDSTPITRKTDADDKSSRRTLPAALSPVVISKILGERLNFDGLVVTDALDMKGLTDYVDQPEAAVKAVAAGADMLIKPSNPDDVLTSLVDAVKKKRISESRITQAVTRILAAKYDLGLTRQRLTPLDRPACLLSNRDVTAFTEAVSERAITLVRDDAKLLPIPDLRPNARIFILAITNGDDRLSIAQPFMSVMSQKNRTIDLLVLDERSSEADLQKAFELAKGAAITITSLYCRFRSGEALSIKIPEVGKLALDTLISRGTPLVAINFGNPYLLRDFPGLKTYVVAYGDMQSLQTAAARAILGEIDITGRLPMTLTLQLPRGSGIDLRKKSSGSSSHSE